MVAAQRDIFLTHSICAFLYKTTADNLNKMPKWKIMIAVMLLLIRPSGTCAHIIAAFEPPLISGRCVLCPPPRIPQPIICQNPADKEIWRRALQKSTSQRVPEIHLHKSTNPVQHVRVILLRRICSRPEIPSSPRCQQQTDTSSNLHKIGEATPSQYCRVFWVIQKAAKLSYIYIV